MIWTDLVSSDIQFLTNVFYVEMLHQLVSFQDRDEKDTPGSV